MNPSRDDPLWNGEEGTGGISWADRSRMGPLRGVIDAADTLGRRNYYMHALHLRVVKKEIELAAPVISALDFGCGTGRFIEALTAHSKHVAAADREPEMVHAARIYAADCDAEIVCCEAASVPFGNGEFDFVLCSSVLCVTAAELIHDIVKELARVTRPGGTLLLLEQVAEARGLAASRYYDALRAAGFKLVRAYPIRSASSKFTAIAARSICIPLSLLDRMAAVELLVTRHVPRPRPARYVEYAIVARRR